jgi:hypothetical protein
MPRFVRQHRRRLECFRLCFLLTAMSASFHFIHLSMLSSVGVSSACRVGPYFALLLARIHSSLGTFVHSFVFRQRGLPFYLIFPHSHQSGRSPLRPCWSQRQRASSHATHAGAYAVFGIGSGRGCLHGGDRGRSPFAESTISP